MELGCRASGISLSSSADSADAQCCVPFERVAAHGAPCIEPRASLLVSCARTRRRRREVCRDDVGHVKPSETQSGGLLWDTERVVLQRQVYTTDDVQQETRTRQSTREKYATPADLRVETRCRGEPPGALGTSSCTHADYVVVGVLQALAALPSQHGLRHIPTLSELRGAHARRVSRFVGRAGLRDWDAEGRVVAAHGSMRRSVPNRLIRPAKVPMVQSPLPCRPRAASSGSSHPSRAQGRDRRW